MIWTLHIVNKIDKLEYEMDIMLGMFETSLIQRYCLHDHHY